MEYQFMKIRLHVHGASITRNEIQEPINMKSEGFDIWQFRTREDGFDHVSGTLPSHTLSWDYASSQEPMLKFSKNPWVILKSKCSYALDITGLHGIDGFEGNGLLLPCLSIRVLRHPISIAYIKDLQMNRICLKSKWHCIDKKWLLENCSLSWINWILERCFWETSLTARFI